MPTLKNLWTLSFTLCVMQLGGCIFVDHDHWHHHHEHDDEVSIHANI